MQHRHPYTKVLVPLQKTLSYDSLVASEVHLDCRSSKRKRKLNNNLRYAFSTRHDKFKLHKNVCGIVKQSAFTSSKSTMETSVQCVKPFQVNNKDTERCHWRRSGVFIVYFEYIVISNSSSAGLSKLRARWRAWTQRARRGFRVHEIACS